MSYQPRVRPAGVEPFVHPFGRHGFVDSVNAVANPSSAAYPAANRAHYFPVVIPVACTIYRLFWLNGATASTNNVQVGIYNDNDAGADGPGTSVVLGTSTLASGASICQFDNITDTALSPGRYWIAVWCNGTTTTLHRSAPSASLGRFVNGYLESSLAGGLPATATPAQQTTPYVPVFGFTTISTP